MKELLEKYIRDNCTPEELRKVLVYINTPQGGSELEELLLADWEDFTPKKEEEGSAHELQARIANRTGKQPAKLTLRYSWIGYAAAVILVTFFGAYFFNRVKYRQEQTKQVAMVEKSTRRGARTVLMLSDSSLVYLGPESRIKFPERFVGTKREVSLEGEAFFEITHNRKKPFIVHTGKLQTQVLGTSFKIEAFKGHLLTISVATGKVSVGYENQNSALKSLAILTPGKIVSWNPSDNSTGSSVIPIENVRNLKNGNLAFTDARLDKIALDLSRWYNINIVIHDRKITTYQLSITINGKATINAALDAITAATGLKYSITKNQITIGQQ